MFRAQLYFFRPFSSLVRHVPFHLAPDVTAGGRPRCWPPVGFVELWCCSCDDLFENLETGLCCGSWYVFNWRKHPGVVVKDQERVVALRVQNERFYADGPDWG